jgi:hypothetical protein
LQPLSAKNRERKKEFFEKIHIKQTGSTRMGLARVLSSTQADPERRRRKNRPSAVAKVAVGTEGYPEQNKGAASPFP